MQWYGGERIFCSTGPMDAKMIRNLDKNIILRSFWIILKLELSEMYRGHSQMITFYELPLNYQEFYLTIQCFPMNYLKLSVFIT